MQVLDRVILESMFRPGRSGSRGHRPRTSWCDTSVSAGRSAGKLRAQPAPKEGGHG
jgi:hypothetical protein